MPVNAATRKLTKTLKQKGFKEVITLNQLRNLPKEFNKAVHEEKRRLGIPPEVRAASPPPQDPPRKMTANETQKFEESLLKILEENTTNNASDPGTPRSRGGRRRCVTRRRRGCRFVHKH
jgi:hypothetical protein